MESNLTDPKELPPMALKKIRAVCKGNGAEPDAIQIKSSRGKILKCQAITHIELQKELKAKKTKAPPKSAQLLENAKQVSEITEKWIEGALKNEETRKLLANILLKRDDQGFSSHGEIIPVKNLNQQYAYHESCTACNARGTVTCQNCSGHRQERCRQCHGQRAIPCQQCHGSGTMQGPNGPQQCTRCHGRRQVGCNLCQSTGVTVCQLCKGTGTVKCHACNGAGGITYLTLMDVHIKTLFEIDRSEIPPTAVGSIEKEGQKLARQKHIQLNAQQVKRDDGGLALQYDITFPYGEMEITINGKEYKIKLMGYKAKIVNNPRFLDILLNNEMDNLEAAARNEGNIVSKVRKATRARLLATSFKLCLNYPSKKALLLLKRQFPFGISNQLLQNIIPMTKKSIKNLTRKMRFAGLGLGALVTAVMDGAYLLTPLRSYAGGLLNNMTGIMLLDLGVILFGGFVGSVAARYFAQKPLRQALAHVINPKDKKTFKISHPMDLWISYFFSALLFLAISYAGKLNGNSYPHWLPF